ncbi:hypothetical protein EYF80_016874 [Liparis tanakae]|uniref:Uncharacterized protein n=1 Tax=Liparis tanakae TaxID=230148 RepID=A0A4Z2I655_9TELE|nr:hypothetical protein EYF80_016874 [Liparis tanakae]
MLLLSCGERPSQHRHGRLGSLQFGSRGRTEGSGGGAAAAAILVAADGRALLGLGFAGLEKVGACFCEANLDWVTGARGCASALVLVDTGGALVARRGEDVAIVFMFLSSLWKPGPCGLGPATALVRLLTSKRRGFGG